MDKFITDFDYFWNLIETNQNFAFSRYADGEVMLMKGESVNENTQAFTVDRWRAPNELTKAGTELRDSMNHTEDNFYYAISGKNDNHSDYDYLKASIKHNDNNITFVNLWINANYGRMKEKLTNLNREVVLICNHRANKANFPFNVIGVVPFPDDCVNYWENNGDSYIEVLKNQFNGYSNKLFFISCGPVSEIIISKLYEFNPNNTYVDVGSSIDEFIHGYQTRPYMDPSSQYYNMISTF